MKQIIVKMLIGGCAALLGTSAMAQDVSQLPFRNPNLPLEERVNDLIGRLTLDEKVQLMKHGSPAIPRLGIPAYNWWNEALHGVARTPEKVTSFPQAIAMAATFDAPALQRMGDITATEGRALYNEALREGKGVAQYRGLTYWTPNINIFRDPRWGRGQETYGEDPYLTAKMGTAIVRGLEGDDPYYLKSVACAKHFAVHSGPEESRHVFDARPTNYDLWDTYLPAFYELVTKAHVHGVMCAYNRVDGQPCCGNDPLMVDILRNQWRFDGYVTTDCGAMNDFYAYHKTHTNATTAMSDALLAGTDLECGNLYKQLAEGVRQGLHSERDINTSLTRLFKILFRIGMFDPAGRDPYSNIGRDVLECSAHKQHAYRMAQESMVLLKNNGILPLNASKVKSIALVGPNADNGSTQLANYYGTPSEIVTPLMSLNRRFGGKIKIDYMQGTGLVKPIENGPSAAEVAKRAAKSDVIVFVCGLSADYEGEAGDAGAGGYAGFNSGDRANIMLPDVQLQLLKQLKKTGKPVIVVNMSGSAIAMEWENRNVDAILQAWYGGQAAGDAIVDVLFGEYNPGGRLPVTVYACESDLPPFDSYSMVGRTYRYFRGEPLYPFGYGLSYTTFAYSDVKCVEQATTGATVTVTATVRNTGKRAGDEVAQLYVTHPQNGVTIVPLCSLKGFKRVHLQPGESTTVQFELTPQDLSLTNDEGNWMEKAGDVNIFVGGGQPKYSKGVDCTLKLTGEPYQVL
ncbi:MAG: glycoside hydrolase family 3 C-terminal domain-containing protein [Muribaculaceae bacterium]